MRTPARLVTTIVLLAAATACTDAGSSLGDCADTGSCVGTTASQVTTAPATQPTVPSTPTATTFPRAVSAGGLSFTLPPELRFRANGFVSTGEEIETFYANVPIGSACTPGCGLPSFSPLPPDAVVVGMGVMSGFGAGAPDPNDPAPNTSIAGQAAVFIADKPGDCGGDETIAVHIPDEGFNDFVLRACLQGPDLAAVEQIVQTLLASAAPSS